MATLTIGEPNEKQRAFLLAREKYIAFGGRAGRREKLGGARQGGAALPALPGH